ncbi:phage shock protein operon transcriptional activator [Thalassospira sp. MA62]|nr:phage shock protein operon transcriptional activator [Thalassospira sp. MA62]
MNNLQPILGEDPVFLAALEHVSRLAPIERPCLVIGERGSGKELIAARLHYLSRRWGGPLVKVNCAALTESLLDTELFGHEAGAFTGATKRHIGRFERAHGGTIILDEIANASPVVQEKLLRVVEYGEIERVGGSDVIEVDTRVIGVTNENLRELAKTNKFRADLLDRLAFDVIAVPPLRQRPDDILLLAEQFALEMTKRLGRSVFPGFSHHAGEQLLRHSWPGNIRELRNAVERSIYLSNDDETPLSRITLDPFDGVWSETNTSTATHSDPIDTPEPDSSGTVDFKSQVANFEIKLLQQALRTHANNQTEAAKALHLNYHQFRRLLEKHDLLPGRSPQNDPHSHKH